MPNTQGLYAGLLAIAGWGTAGLFIKLLPPISPVWISAVRSLVAVLVLLGFMVSQSSLRPLLYKLNSKITWELAFYTAGFYFCAVVAYQLASVAEAALVLSTTPLFILLWGMLRGNPVANKDTIGALVACSGVVLIFLPRLQFSVDHTAIQFYGLLAALCGCLIIAVFVLRMRHLANSGRQPDVWGVNLLAFFILSAPLFFALFSAGERRSLLQSWEGNMKWIVLALGILSTAIPGVAYAFASIQLSPILTTSLRFLTPVVATILAAIFLQEIPSIHIYSGGILVLMGLVWMTFGQQLKRWLSF